jgi:hypothetical protein
MIVKFDLNNRHVMEVNLNSVTGRCDVNVCDTQTNRSFSKSMLLDQYNRLVDWFRENDGAFAINAAHSLF